MKKISIAQIQTSRLAKVVLFIITLAAVSVFAWNATWHGTDWVQSGKIITAKDLAENFEYLYQNKVDKPPSDCFGTQAKLQWKNNQWECGQLLLGCKLRYRAYYSGYTTDWVETPFGGVAGGNFVYGPTLHVGYLGSAKVQVGVYCEDSTLKMGYKIRGNRGPYWDSGMTVVQSQQGQWVDGGWSGTGSYSCAVKGGDATCGMAVKDYIAPHCTTIVEIVNRGTSDRGDVSTYGGATSGGASDFRYGIKCSE